ncbi:MAG: RdgB/HAM1 family non-canonical purine NTP pyrophosphatase [Sphingobacteriales bacterium]|nr:MAG: RdgB/HAM1 family non-canonical purine NTP pyrophosphatase [Sphingobacteriales bacterium]
MHELVIASNNAGKIKEIRQMIDSIKLLSLADVGFTAEIEEPYQTFEENARVKAETIHQFSGKNVFADDSGICLNALDGAPGVNSAYFAGLPRDDERNLQKVLEVLKNKEDRAAYYKALICLVWDGEVHYFEGICNGRILEQKMGNEGFGYDPIFVPNGYDKTFGELQPEVKNELSHRGKAVRKMVEFLKTKTGVL